MRRKISVLIALLVFSSSIVTAQLIVSNDTTVCGSYSADLYAISSTAGNITADDGYSGIIPIGFDFEFYGNIYTDLLISGNGYITFDISSPGGYSPYSITSAMPNGSFQNAIMGPWQDLYPPGGGSITYSLVGIAPNRQFQVTWCSVPMYSCTSFLNTFQIVLYEGSNKIEMHIQDKLICTGFNGGNAVQGLVDASSANFDIVFDPILLADRNYPLQWAANNEGWEFLPNGPTSYTINAIPFVPIIAGVTTWFSDPALTNVLATGPILPITITSTASYYASMSGGCFPGALVDTITITMTDCYSLDINTVWGIKPILFCQAIKFCLISKLSSTKIFP